MPSMMKSRSKRRVLSDLATLLSDPSKLQEELKKFQSQIKDYDEQIGKKAKLLEQQKAQAQAILAELEQKKKAHDERENQLDQEQKQHSLWQASLDHRETNLAKSSKEFEDKKLQFEQAQKDALTVLQERSAQIASLQDQFNQKHRELTSKLGEVEQKHYELLNREASVTKREAFLVGIINQLKA